MMCSYIARKIIVHRTIRVDVTACSIGNAEECIESTTGPTGSDGTGSGGTADVKMNIASDSHRGTRGARNVRCAGGFVGIGNVYYRTLICCTAIGIDASSRGTSDTCQC